METEKIETIFKEEFGQLADKFAILNIPLNAAEKNNEKYVWHPGVYVFWHPEHKVVRVGRSLDNTRKRALQHVDGNTHNEKISIRALHDDERTRLLLFNVKDPADAHWAAALEIFFENKLNPAIAAKHMG
jgi:hypothetical protein